jgi:hypothetical protein
MPTAVSSTHVAYREGSVNLTIYGDFNCPFSALASAKVDVLLARGDQIEWRAVQHDTTIPEAGEPLDGDSALALAAEIATILQQDAAIHLRVPPVRSNTALACAAFAAAGADGPELRGRFFAAVWEEGRNLGSTAELRRLHAGGHDLAGARRWQDQFDALSHPMTPTLVLPDGYVSRGLGALARLAELASR